MTPLLRRPQTQRTCTCWTQGAASQHTCWVPRPVWMERGRPCLLLAPTPAASFCSRCLQWALQVRSHRSPVWSGHQRQQHPSARGVSCGHYRWGVTGCMVHLGTNTSSILQLKMPAVGMTGEKSEVTRLVWAAVPAASCSSRCAKWACRWGVRGHMVHLGTNTGSILQLKMPAVGITGEWFVWAPILAAFWCWYYLWVPQNWRLRILPVDITDEGSGVTWWLLVALGPDASSSLLLKMPRLRHSWWGGGTWFLCALLPAFPGASCVDHRWEMSGNVVAVGTSVGGWGW